MEKITIFASVDGRGGRRRISRKTYELLRERMLLRKKPSGELYPNLLRMAIEKGKKDYLSYKFVIECLKKI